MFDRICRENGITHHLTPPRTPTTTGKIERFHQTLQNDWLTDCPGFASMADAQAALDAFVAEYNTNRPHQSLDMDFPTDRFKPRPVDASGFRLAAEADMTGGHSVGLAVWNKGPIRFGRVAADDGPAHPGPAAPTDDPLAGEPLTTADLAIAAQSSTRQIGQFDHPSLGQPFRRCERRDRRHHQQGEPMAPNCCPPLDLWR
jgi:hypothetical protein